MSITLTIVYFFQSFVLLMIAVSVHEFAHGWVAFMRGDTTAKYSGRLTLNPLAHIDPFWTLLLPLLLFVTSQGNFVFGAAKPVPINYWALKNPKRDILWVGLAGPLANFIFALIIALLLKFLPLPPFVTKLLVINVVLAIFNLIPVPPLDGSRILMGLLPAGPAAQFARIEPYGFIILVLLISTGGMGLIIWPLIDLVLRMLGVSL